MEGAQGFMNGCKTGHCEDEEGDGRGRWEEPLKEGEDTETVEENETRGKEKKGMEERNEHGGGRE